MKITPEQLHYENMELEERIIMNMYFKHFRYSEIVSYLGRAGIKYKGRSLKESYVIGSIIESIIKEHSREIDYF